MNTSQTRQWWYNHNSPLKITKFQLGMRKKTHIKHILNVLDHIRKRRNTSKTNLSSKNLRIGKKAAKRGRTMKSSYWGKDSCSHSIKLAISRKPIFKKLPRTLQFRWFMVPKKEQKGNLEICAIIILGKEACFNTSFLVDYKKRFESFGVEHLVIIDFGSLFLTQSQNRTYPIFF